MAKRRTKAEIDAARRAENQAALDAAVTSQPLPDGLGRQVVESLSRALDAAPTPPNPVTPPAAEAETEPTKPEPVTFEPERYDAEARQADAAQLPTDEPRPERPQAERRGNFTTYRDSKQGIRIEKELERRPGQNTTQLLIRFAPDKKPSPEERQRLKDEGFRWQPDTEAWGIVSSAAHMELAKRVVNDVLKGRGDSYSIYL